MDEYIVVGLTLVILFEKKSMQLWCTMHLTTDQAIGTICGYQVATRELFARLKGN